MIRFEETITVNASAEKIFQIYENVAEWHLWDSEIQSASIDGEFKVGAIGRLKPKKGPEAKIEILEVSKTKNFTAISKLPLCVMTFEHDLITQGNSTEVIHSVSFTGLAAFIFGKLIGSGIKKGLPVTLKGLKELAESEN